ncbi:hypothetical protein [Massilia sp. DD77]|uniref:hypothetical protein n=1 Tax=Massilia sp. DD77 TaxID=3109349 RepID=UPI0030006D4D
MNKNKGGQQKGKKKCKKVRQITKTTAKIFRFTEKQAHILSNNYRPQATTGPNRPYDMHRSIFSSMKMVAHLSFYFRI